MKFTANNNEKKKLQIMQALRMHKYRIISRVKRDRKVAQIPDKFTVKRNELLN